MTEWKIDLTGQVLGTTAWYFDDNEPAQYKMYLANRRVDDKNVSDAAYTVRVLRIAETSGDDFHLLCSRTGAVLGEIWIDTAPQHWQTKTSEKEPPAKGCIR